MKPEHLIVILVVFAAVAILTADAHAMYNPRMGRFLQRDPGPAAGSPARVGAAGPAIGGGFAQRDPISPYAGHAQDEAWPGHSHRFNDPIAAQGMWKAGSEHTAEFIAASHLAQYTDGMNLYQYVASNPTRYLDPKGTDIYLINGNPGAGSTNDALHQKVCADLWGPRRCKKIGKACFSFGKVGWMFRVGARLNWLGWRSYVLGGLVMKGEICEDGPGGKVVKTKKTRPAQDVAWVKWMRKWRVGTQDVYSVGRHSCRKYSQWEYRDAP